MSMLPEQSKPVKSPKNAERPFPWRCRHCGKVEVRPTKTDYALDIRYDGRLVPIVARDIDIPTCQNCHQTVITLDVDDAVNSALCARLNLLTPDQIRDGIEKLGLSQKEVAERLGIAEATISRWVNKCVIQSRAMDNYLRVFFQFPDVRAALSAPAIETSLDMISTPNVMT